MAMISISAASRIAENCSLLSPWFWVRDSKIVVKCIVRTHLGKTYWNIIWWSS